MTAVTFTHNYFCCDIPSPVAILEFKKWKGKKNVGGPT